MYVTLQLYCISIITLLTAHCLQTWSQCICKEIVYVGAITEGPMKIYNLDKI
jgi:hypothetical protein